VASLQAALTSGPPQTHCLGLWPLCAQSKAAWPVTCPIKCIPDASPVSAVSRGVTGVSGTRVIITAAGQLPSTEYVLYWSRADFSPWPGNGKTWVSAVLVICQKWLQILVCGEERRGWNCKDSCREDVVMCGLGAQWLWWVRRCPSQAGACPCAPAAVCGLWEGWAWSCSTSHSQ
jgi:hypothetical protein